MDQRRSRLPQRILSRRQQDHSPAAIARYVHNVCHTSWSRKFTWTHDELQELERLDRKAAKVRAEKARRRAMAAASAAHQTATLRVSLPHRISLGRKGLSPMAVQTALGCSAVEFDRWTSDGRLPPDGEKLYVGVGPRGGNKWGRAWLSETVENAMLLIDEWRARDEETARRWISEATLFDLVQSRFPDAIFQWSPEWLGRQSVDIFIPSLCLAIEYQGEQHYRPLLPFGGEEGFRDTVVRDGRKRELLRQHAVTLIEWRFDRAITDAEFDRVLAVAIESTIASIQVSASRT